MGFWIRSGVKV